MERRYWGFRSWHLPLLLVLGFAGLKAMEELKDRLQPQTISNSNEGNYPNIRNYRIIWDDGTVEKVESYGDEVDLDEERLKRCLGRVSSNVPSGIPITGLEFTDTWGNKYPQIDKDYFLGESSTSSPDTYFEFVLEFIRNVKGLPVKRRKDLLAKVMRQRNKEKGTLKTPEWSFLPYHLSDLAKMELKIYDMLKIYALGKDYKNLEMPSLILESYLKDFEESTLKALSQVNVSNSRLPEKEKEGPYFYVGTHPTLIYMMIRRFTEDLPEILLWLKDHDQILFKNIIRIRDESGFQFPARIDLEESIKSLHTIISETDITIPEIANGFLEFMDTGIKLNALHLLEIGAYHAELKYPELALYWFHQGLQIMENSKFSKNFTTVQFFFDRCQGHAAQMHNFYLNKVKVAREEANNTLEHYLFTKEVTYPFHPAKYESERDLLLKRREKLRLDLWQEAKVSRISKINSELNVLCSLICSGYNFQTKEEKLGLKCWYETKVNGYFMVNPLKTELLSKEPPVVQIHDFISPILSNILRTSAMDRLDRSPVHKENLEGYGDIRTSYQAWLEERYAHPAFEFASECPDCESYKKALMVFSKRLELLTGLNVQPLSSSETYQVAVYGSSHHFGVHLDVNNKSDGMTPFTSTRSRMITVMGYLNDVKVGGRTAFPILGFSVTPTKGSILLWNNLMNDFDHVDDRMFHAGCPVLLGVKWIMNKWIWDEENMFNYKCGLNTPKVFLAGLEQ